MGSATGTSRREDTCSTLGKEATGTPADGVAAAAAAALAAAAAGLKKRLRLCNHVSIPCPPLSILFLSPARNLRRTAWFIVSLLESRWEAVRAIKFAAP